MLFQLQKNLINNTYIQGATENRARSKYPVHSHWALNFLIAFIPVLSFFLLQEGEGNTSLLQRLHTKVEENFVQRRLSCFRQVNPMFGAPCFENALNQTTKSLHNSLLYPRSL